jgi:hypothetical protein
MTCNILTFYDELFLFVMQSTIWVSVFLYSRQSLIGFQKQQKKQGRSKLTVLDHVFGALLVFCLAMVVMQRYERGVMHWMLQPCHVMNTVLIYVIYSAKLSAFKFYVYSVWMPWLGILLGDMSIYTKPGEYEIFWLQHILLVSIPVFYLMTKRYHVRSDEYHAPENWSYFVLCYSCAMLYHVLVLLQAGNLFNTDYDSLKCPPAGLDAFVGKWWREVSVVAVFFLALLVSYLPEYLIGRWHKSREQTKQQPRASPALTARSISPQQSTDQTGVNASSIASASASPAGARRIGGRRY